MQWNCFCNKLTILPFHNLIFSKDFFTLWIVFAWSIIPGNCFLSTWQLLFHFYEENIVLLLCFIGSHSFNKPRSLFFNEFPAVGSSNLTYISSSKVLLGLLKLIYPIVPMESLISLSTTLILIVRRNRTPTQVFKMILSLQFGRGSDYLGALCFKYLFPHLSMNLQPW